MKTAINLEKEICILVDDLGNEHGLVRRRARLNLADLGKESVHELMKVISSPSTNIRPGAIKVLGELHASEAAKPLVPMLMDNDPDIRGSTMESLIRIGRTSRCLILETLVRNFDSSIMHEGVHYILHVFKDQ